MIEKLYVDNFKSLVNFEFEPGPVQLLLGRNGTGKSTFLEVLDILRSFLIESDYPTYRSFPKTSLTRWDGRDVQTFELSVRLDGGLYVYRLEVEQYRDSKAAKVLVESLLLDGLPLFEFLADEVQLYRDDHSKGPRYPGQAHRSGLATILSRHDNTKLTYFMTWIQKLCCVIIDDAIKSSGDSESTHPDARLYNFVTWYQFLSLERPDAVQELIEVLRAGAIAEFRSLQFV